MSAARFGYPAAVCLVIVVYIAARFWGLTGSCLWFDEIYSLHAAEHDLGGLFRFVGLDLIHPPLFYLLLKIWITIGGEQLVWLRSLPVVLAIIAIAPFMGLCRELKLGRWPALFALFLLAVNGSAIKYSQEVRMYSLLMCLSLFSAWLFFRYVNSKTSIAVLLVINILLVHSHYFGWLVVGSEIIVASLYFRGKLFRLLAVGGVTAASFLPWLLVVLGSRNEGGGLAQNVGWIAQPGLAEIGTLILNLAEPFYYRSSSTEPVANLVVVIPMLAVAVTVGGLYLVVRSTHADGPRLEPVVVMLVTPLVVVFVASWILPYSFWGTRHLIIVFPLFAIVAAAMVAEIVSSHLRIAIVSVVVLLSCVAAIATLRIINPEQSWCVAEQILTTSAATTKRVVVTEDLIAYHAWFALKGKDVSIEKLEGLPGATEDTAFFLPRGFDGVRRVAFDDLGNGEATLLLRMREWNRHAPPIIALEEAGYTLGIPRVVDAADTKVIVLDIRK